MISDEFAFIHKYFAHLNPSFAAEAQKMGLKLGIGDDAALIRMAGTYAITTDTLIENVHFFTHFNPYLLGARTLEVNFSDLYAMGACPQFVTLSLNVPERYFDFDEFWTPYSEGLAECLERHHCALIGGNVTHTTQKTAPLTLSVTAIGKSLVEGKSLRRDQAEVGDFIVVTGYVGTNGLYVRSTYNNAIRNIDSDLRRIFEQQAFAYDERMRDFVTILLQYSNCGIDVSDGLLGDLSHILVQSNSAAVLDYESLPLNPLAQSLLEDFRMSSKSLLKFALSGGGDYNLIFTVNPRKYESLQQELKANEQLRGFKVTKIGEITEWTDDSALMRGGREYSNELSTDGGRIMIVNHEGVPVSLHLGTGSYNHFINQR